MKIDKEKVSVFISSKCDSEEDKKSGNVKYGVMYQKCIRWENRVNCVEEKNS